MFRTLIRSTLNTFLAHAGPHCWPQAGSRLWILMYHRILPNIEAMQQHEEPGMFVTPETFARHLTWLREFMTPVKLSDWLLRRECGKELPKRAFAITFDDGWRDNYTYAYPILKKSGVQATIFAVSGMIGTNSRFWPNLLSEALIGLNNAPEWPPEYVWLKDLTDIRPNQLESADARAAVIAACKQLADDEIYTHLQDITHISKERRQQGRLMLDWDELREMQQTDVIEVGSHTQSHYRLLETLAPSITEKEIIESKSALEQRLDRPIDLFCYPNGDISPHAAKLVRDHYKAAVTTHRGVNSAEQSAYELLRIGMHEDISNTRNAFLARLSGWR